MRVQSPASQAQQVAVDMGNLLKEITAKKQGFAAKVLGVAVEEKVKAVQNANKANAINLPA